ncbi:DNA-binding transcriptional regulator, MarR family [Sphingobium faniae]|nr:DNA-binding transcriptional regulator, MarR family [Sphingobium faniae]
MVRKMLRLDQLLPYRLSVAANRVSHAIAGAYERLFALSVPQWRLLAVLAENEGATQNEIGRKTVMDQVTLSRAVHAPARRGLIVRSPHPRDGRSRRLFLSGEARDLYRRIAPKALELEDHVFSSLSQEDLARFREILDHVARKAGELADAGDQDSCAGMGRK